MRMHASGRLDFDVGAVVDGLALPKENCIVRQRCSRFLGLTPAIYGSRAASSVLIEVFLDGQSNAPVPADPAELFAVESIGGNVTRVRLDALDDRATARVDDGRISSTRQREHWRGDRAAGIRHGTGTPRPHACNHHAPPHACPACVSHGHFVVKGFRKCVKRSCCQSKWHREAKFSPSQQPTRPHARPLVVAAKPWPEVTPTKDEIAKGLHTVSAKHTR